MDMLSAFDSPDAAAKIKTFPLSRRTIRHRVGDIASSISKTLKQKITQAKFVSIAVDESVDISSTGQIVMLIRGIDKHFYIFEELASIGHLKGRSTGNIIFNEIIAAADNLNLDFPK